MPSDTGSWSDLLGLLHASTCPPSPVLPYPSLFEWLYCSSHISIVVHTNTSSSTCSPCVDSVHSPWTHAVCVMFAKLLLSNQGVEQSKYGNEQFLCIMLCYTYVQTVCWVVDCRYQRGGTCIAPARLLPAPPPTHPHAANLVCAQL